MKPRLNKIDYSAVLKVYFNICWRKRKNLASTVSNLIFYSQLFNGAHLLTSCKCQNIGVSDLWYLRFVYWHTCHLCNVWNYSIIHVIIVYYVHVIILELVTFHLPFMIITCTSLLCLKFCNTLFLPTDSFYDSGLSVTHTSLHGTSCLHFTASQFWEEPPYWILRISSRYSLFAFLHSWINIWWIRVSPLRWCLLVQ